MFKSNVVSPLDWKRREEVKQDLDDAHYHMAEGVRLLNERFADPKQALTPASLLGAALLGMCPVRNLLPLFHFGASIILPWRASSSFQR
jgi:hypothetical protein